jgi:hypothetical protein
MEEEFGTRIFRPIGSNKGKLMRRIYIFKSQTRKGLHAFAGDPDGSKLPPQHAPWTTTGVVRPEKDPPYNFSREAIEEAIDSEGFQLWRLGKKTEAPSDGIPKAKQK